MSNSQGTSKIMQYKELIVAVTALLMGWAVSSSQRTPPPQKPATQSMTLSSSGWKPI